VAATLLDKWRLLMLIALDPAMTKADIAVAAVIIDHCNASDDAWPSLDTIAARTKSNRSTVTRSAGRLEKHSYIARSRSAGRHSTTYRPAFALVTTGAPVQQLNAPPTGAAAHQLEDTNWCADAPELVRPCTSTGAPARPYPSYDPSHDPAQGSLAPEPVGGDLVQIAYDELRARFEAAGMPVPRELNRNRRAALGGRLNDCGGLTGWRRFLDKATASTFLREQFKPGIDWVLKPANFLKVIEGNYDNRSPTRGGAGDLMAAVEAYGRRDQ
jgi:hypothetical protein